MNQDVRYDPEAKVVASRDQKMADRTEPAQSRRSARLARRNQSEEAARRSDAMGEIFSDGPC